MLIKLISIFVLFLTALIEKIWGEKISKSKTLKYTVFILFIFSLIISASVIIIDDVAVNEKLEEQRRIQGLLIVNNDSLQNKIDSLIKGNITTQEKISSLESKLDPFISIALKKYPNYNVEEALIKFREELESVKLQAAPNRLSIQYYNTQKVESGYEVEFQFIPSRNQVPVNIKFDISLIDILMPAEILKINISESGGAYLKNKESIKISDNKKSANINFSLLSYGYPTLQITVSNICKIKISGNYLDRPYLYEVTKDYIERFK